MSDEAKTQVPKQPKAAETAASLINDWRVLLTQATEETERFTKEKPLIALAASFTAGMVFNEIMSALFRRRR
ncbi:MAG: hypothetical protein IT381_08905 [Deltaproteobacteria bacterium]|nr:hypothetical protein [Deltaproteobacteria bacterium]